MSANCPSAYHISDKQMITVATYNIHKAHSMTRGCHLNELKSGLKEMDADLICLQKCRTSTPSAKARYRSSTVIHKSPHCNRQSISPSILPMAPTPFTSTGITAMQFCPNTPLNNGANIDVSDHRLERLPASDGVLHATLDHPVLGEVHVINSTTLWSV